MTGVQTCALPIYLIVFPAETSHVLEYWLDASMFSRWERNNLVKIPWNSGNCERDVKLYSEIGIKSVTTFATWMISGDYLKEHGENYILKIVKEYGSILETILE